MSIICPFFLHFPKLKQKNYDTFESDTSYLKGKTSIASNQIECCEDLEEKGNLRTE